MLSYGHLNGQGFYSTIDSRNIYLSVRLRSPEMGLMFPIILHWKVEAVDFRTDSNLIFSIAHTGYLQN